MNVLIYSTTHDVHVAAVALALGDQGHRVDVIHGKDYPTRACMSARIGASADLRLSHTLDGAESVLSDVHSVWNRRYVAHELPEDAVHAADHAFASREARSFADGARLALAQRAFWSNPPQGQALARQKLVQLRLARQLGLSIPETLISNDKKEIVEFCRHQGGSVVYKPHTPATWLAADRGRNMSCLFTAVCREADLAELPESAFQLCPGIYQAYVDKQYEVRSTFFGAEELSVRLESQELESGRTDWRRGQLQGMAYRPHSLPAALREKCRALMQALGIVSGCFDFIVDGNGDYVFLEVNESGQFLWVEQRCAEIPMLDTFCDFLAARDPAYRRRCDSVGVTFAQLRKDPRLNEWLQRDLATHVNAEAWHVATE